MFIIPLSQPQLILRLFNFQPRCSYKISLIKKRVFETSYSNVTNKHGHWIMLMIPIIISVKCDFYVFGENRRIFECTICWASSPLICKIKNTVKKHDPTCFELQQIGETHHVVRDVWETTLKHVHNINNILR